MQWDPVQLLLGFKLHAMLGVEYLSGNNVSVNASVLPVLDHYERLGLLDLRQSSYISPSAEVED